MNGVAFMNDNLGAPLHSGSAAREYRGGIHGTVYAIMLRRGVEGSWLDLELSLWRALREAVRKAGLETSLPPST